jgi:hypothetical protein
MDSDDEDDFKPAAQPQTQPVAQAKPVAKKNNFLDSDDEDDEEISFKKAPAKTVPAQTLKPPMKNKRIGSDDDEPAPVAAKPIAKKGIFAGGSDDDSDDFKPKAKPVINQEI